MTPWEHSHCPIVISQVTKGLVLMLSGGSCWSLWEHLGVWMTLTGTVSRVPIIQLNPDSADKARCARLSVYASVYARGQTKTSEHKSNASVCVCAEGDVAPVAVDLGHTAASSARHTDGQR